MESGNTIDRKDLTDMASTWLVNRVEVEPGVELGYFDRGEASQSSSSPAGLKLSPNGLNISTIGRNRIGSSLSTCGAMATAQSQITATGSQGWPLIFALRWMFLISKMQPSSPIRWDVLLSGLTWNCSATRGSGDWFLSTRVRRSSHNRIGANMRSWLPEPSSAQIR